MSDESAHWPAAIAAKWKVERLFSQGFEAPRDLRSRKVQVRFDRLHFERAIVYYKGERVGEARPVDFVANDRKPSKKSEVQS